MTRLLWHRFMVLLPHALFTVVIAYHLHKGTLRSIILNSKVMRLESIYLPVFFCPSMPFSARSTGLLTKVAEVLCRGLAVIHVASTKVHRGLSSQV